MEDFKLDLIIGEGPAARSVKIDLARFTLIGAASSVHLLTAPLRARFKLYVRPDSVVKVAEELDQPKQ
jgi:holliday junction DNA helicase RuvB